MAENATVALTYVALRVIRETGKLVVILTTGDGPRAAMAIVVNDIVARAIAAAAEPARGERRPGRPYVHDVAAALAARGGLVLERVLVDGLDDDGVLDAILFGTFADGTPFAPVHLRPSDGIALALRTGAALEVAEEVWRRVDRYDAANLPFDELRDGDLAGY